LIRQGSIKLESLLALSYPDEGELFNMRLTFNGYEYSERKIINFYFIDHH
jgi:hypothetical protein